MMRQRYKYIHLLCGYRGHWLNVQVGRSWWKQWLSSFITESLLEMILSLLHINNVRLRKEAKWCQVTLLQPLFTPCGTSAADFTRYKEGGSLAYCLTPSFQLFAAEVLGFASVPAAVLCCDGRSSWMRQYQDFIAWCLGTTCGCIWS